MVLLKVDIIIFLMLFLFIFVKMGGIIIFFVLFLKKKIKNYKYYIIVSDEDIKSVCIMCFVVVVVYIEIFVEFYYVVIYRFFEVKFFIFFLDVWNYVIFVIIMYVFVEVG